MRLLTRLEYEVLIDACGACAGADIPDSLRDTFVRLIEEGRIDNAPCRDHGEEHFVLQCTAAGREAIRLYPLIVAAGLKEGSQ